MKTKPVCEKCGSETIYADAWAEWDIATQDWILGPVYDHTECGDCGSTDIEWKDEE